MHIDDLLDPAELADMIGEGLVRARSHPGEPLRILNYTEKAQYEQAWNAVTRTCRGLVTHADTGEVVARPWPKFFNHGQVDAGRLDLAVPVEVTDKLDGSLGVLFALPSAPGSWAVATRGSFESDQAQWASAHYAGSYQQAWQPEPGITYLFEIVYPANRIVLDYGSREDLVLLGAVEIGTGRTLGPWDLECTGWPGPRTDVLDYPTLGDALAAPTRSNAEGLVVRYLGDGPLTGVMVKLKQQDYVALHKIVTGLNARVVWERLGAGETVPQVCESLPDEFRMWVEAVATDLIAAREAVVAAATAEFTSILTRLGTDAAGVDRKAFAALAQGSAHRAWLFLLLDGKDPAAKVWRALRPAADFAPRALPDEDAA